VKRLSGAGLVRFCHRVETGGLWLYVINAPLIYGVAP